MAFELIRSKVCLSIYHKGRKAGKVRKMKTAEQRKAKSQETLNRIRSGHSKNDNAVIAACAMRGYTDAQPRENVLTFNAWKALGRHVKRGERGIAVSVWYPAAEKIDETTSEIHREYAPMKHATAYVFHISQTEPNEKDQLTLNDIEAKVAA